MRLRFAALTLATALTAAGCAISSPVAPPADDAGPTPAPRNPVLAPCPTAGSPSALPSLTLSCLRDGPKVDPAALGGHPVLVNLWASWCGPCRQEMPSLQAAYVTYSTKVSFLGVDTTDSPDSARDFLAATGVHYPQVLDDNGDLLHGVAGVGLPVTIVLDAAGRKVYSHRGQLQPVDVKKALAAAGVVS